MLLTRLAVPLCRRTMLVAGVVALVGLSVPAVASATRYAAPTASGTGDCSSPANACTLPTALALPPDEIVLATGDYGSSATPLASFSIFSGYTVHGPATGALPRIFVNGLGIVLQGGTLRRVDAEGVAGGSYAVNLNSGTVDQVYAHSLGSFAGCELLEGTLTNSVCVGRKGLVENITAAFVNNFSATLRNDTLIGTTANGINLDFSGGLTLAVTASNVIARGATTDIVANNNVTITLDHSDYATVTATNGATVTPAGTATNITAAPLLSADYHELSGSPTIDAGITSALNGTSDLDGNARAQGASTDIGAYEFPAAAPPPPPAAGGSPSPAPTPAPTPAPAAAPGPAPAAAAPATITLAAAPNPVRFASFVTLSGRLTGGSNGGETVTLQADPFPFADNGFADKATTTTAADGSFTFAQAPGLNTRYRVVSSALDAISPVVTVSVAYRVGLSVSVSTPRRGSRVRFYGSVGPRKNGSRASIQRRRSDGRFVTVARVLLVPGTATRSRYSKRLLIRAGGTYRVHVSGDASHVAANSRTRTLTVR